MIPSALINLNHNMLAAVDVETTGLLCGYHEIVQIAVVPLDSDIKPSDKLRPFYINIRPEFPQRQQSEAGRVHDLNLEDLSVTAVGQEKAADLFDEWFVSLELPYKKKLTPLAHNWAFERGFLSHWLGLKTMDDIFHPHARDTMLLATSLNDAAAWHGRPCPFKRVSLTALCERFGVINHNPHDALADALACANVYREFIRYCFR